MKNLIGKNIKIFFNNGATIEGFVTAYNKKRFILSSSSSKDLMIVNNNFDTIMFIKVLIDYNIEDCASESSNVINNNQLIENIKQVPQEPDPPYLEQPDTNLESRTQKIVQQKNTNINNLKKQIANYINNPPIMQASGTNYELPNISK